MDHWIAVTKLIAVVVGIVGGLVAAFKVIWEIQANTKQRKVEHRWKLANLARELISEIHRHELAVTAVTIMD